MGTPTYYSLNGHNLRLQFPPPQQKQGFKCSDGLVFVFKLNVIRSLPGLRDARTDLLLCSFMVVFPFGRIMKLEGHIIAAPEQHGPAHLCGPAHRAPPCDPTTGARAGEAVAFKTF